MGRLILLVVTGAPMVALAATAAFAQTGTEESEAIYRSYSTDRIFGEGGDDLLVGEAGPDLIEGGPGNDFLVAAYGYWQVTPYAPASPISFAAGKATTLSTRQTWRVLLIPSSAAQGPSWSMLGLRTT